MNYAAHYERLIQRARSRTLVGYFERHHVVPRCIGGSNDAWNIVALTAEEHMTAHLLLVRIHSGNRSIFFAAHMMRIGSARMVGRSRNKAYSWLRKRHALATASVHTGRKHSAATLVRLSESHRGIPSNKKGMRYSADVRARMSAAQRGKKMPPKSAEERIRISARMRGTKGNRLGHKNSPEHNARISASNTGRKRSEESRARISAAQLGKKKAPFSIEHRANISAARRRVIENKRARAAQQ